MSGAQPKSGQGVAEKLLKSLADVLRFYPGKALGGLRIPVDLALVKAGFETAEQSANPWVLMVGLAGLMSSIVLIAFADRTSHSAIVDPQDVRHRFKWIMYWKYPWEFASVMAFVKVINLALSGILMARFDDLFLGICILIGQLIVQIPESKPGVKADASASFAVRLKSILAQRPNRYGAHVINVGNIGFALISIYNADFYRFFAGGWNIILNAYLMARSSKRIKAE